MKFAKEKEQLDERFNSFYTNRHMGTLVKVGINIEIQAHTTRGKREVSKYVSSDKLAFLYVALFFICSILAAITAHAGYPFLLLFIPNKPLYLPNVKFIVNPTPSCFARTFCLERPI